MTEKDIQNQKKKQKIEEVVRQFAQKAAAMDIESNVPLDDKQTKLLKQIHVLAINRALNVPEVLRDPRKIAILMTYVLQHHLTKAKYTEDFFLEHIVVYTNKEGTVKHIDLDEVEEKVFSEALYDEIVYDWIIYRSPGSRGIRALSDEKTFNQGLKNFAAGLSPISEFSRFQRKYFEEKQKKTKDDRESAQRAFRNQFVQQVAQAAAKQLLKTQDPMDLAKVLFASKDYETEIQNLLGDMPINREIEKMSKKFSETLAIEDKTKDSEVLRFEEQEIEMPKLISSKERNKTR